MASENCSGLMLVALQGGFSTTVGVSLAFPILSQIIDSKNLRVVQECNRILRKNSIRNDRGAFLDLGTMLNGYQFSLEKLSKMNGVLMILCAAIGTFSFFMLLLSTFLPTLCLPNEYVLCSLGSMAMPFVFGVFYLLCWYDKLSAIRGRIYYYDRQF